MNDFLSKPIVKPLESMWRSERQSMDDHWASVIGRHRAGQSAEWEKRLVWRDGTMADYHRLSEFHYLCHAPFQATRVLVVEDIKQSVVGRFLQQRGRSQPIGVLVESRSALGCQLRNQALRGRYGQWKNQKTVARLLNHEMRCISRVVVHPQWRGMGLAVRLVRWAIETMTTPYIEALAAMGHVHPFFKQAGMVAYQRWPHKKDQRFIDALTYCGVESWELASEQRMAKHLASEHGDWIRGQLGRWAGRRLKLPEQLALARAHLLRDPIYYLATKPTDVTKPLWRERRFGRQEISTTT